MPKPNSTEEPNALKELRERLGLTQAQIAARIQISRSLWSALENKQRPLTVALLNRMADVLVLDDEQINDIREWWGESHLSLPKTAAA